MKNVLLTSVSFLFLILVVSCESNPYEMSVIEMEKTACFGACPQYDIKIMGTGEASFEGRQFAPRQGKYQKMLLPEEVQALFAAFEGGDFWSFEEEYTSNISDLPTTYISFSHGDQAKKIKDYYGSPKELKDLEKLVEDIANSEGWEVLEGEK